MPHRQSSISRSEVAESLYSFPTGVTGKGECIAIIELGGGFKQTDLNAYFGATKPTVTAVSVDGGRNSPTGNAGWSGRVRWTST